MSLTVKTGVTLFQQQCDNIGGGALTLGTPNSSCSYHLHVWAHTIRTKFLHSNDIVLEYLFVHYEKNLSHV